jgi:hypothetical protein
MTATSIVSTSGASASHRMKSYFADGTLTGEEEEADIAESTAAAL